MRTFTNLPIAFRANNPLNIISSPTSPACSFQCGTLYIPKTRQRFMVFRTMKDGYLAALAVLRTYYCHKDLDEVIRRWCPDSTAESYFKRVCDLSGLDKTFHILPSQSCSSYDFAYEHILLPSLLEAMAVVECGSSDLVCSFGDIQDYVKCSYLNYNY